MYNVIGVPTKMENESIKDLLISIEERNEAVEIKALERLAAKVTEDKEALERFEKLLEDDPSMRKLIRDLILKVKSDN